jgi:hypothetical protein
MSRQHDDATRRAASDAAGDDRKEYGTNTGPDEGHDARASDRKPRTKCTTVAMQIYASHV